MNIPSEFLENADIGLSAVAMVIYLAVGFVVSIWIGRRRQLT
jgi:hypothetical protein